MTNTPPIVRLEEALLTEDPRYSVVVVFLTLDEEPNLYRTLAAVTWARRVVVLDSGSTDGTERIARSFSNVDFRTRPFDSLENQWRHAFTETGIEDEFLLALDADMVVTPAFVDELGRTFLPGQYEGGVLPIRWCYHGNPLLGSLCAPQLRLFRRRAVRVRQRGHAHDFAVEGRVHSFRYGVNHDDRKSVDRWITSQQRYSREEENRLCADGRLRIRDRLRRLGLMPAAAAIAAYLRAGGPLGGTSALRYAYERAAYEAVLAIRLLDRAMRKDRE